MIGRRSFLLGAAPALLVAKPALATAVCAMQEVPLPASGAPLQLAVNPDHLSALKSAWGLFCYNADKITVGSMGWQIVGARGREGEHFINLAQVDLDERWQGGLRICRERHTRIEL